MARREDVPLSGEDDDVDIRVSTKLLNGIVKRRDQVAREGVPRGGTVQAQLGDAVGSGQDKIGHA